MGRAYEVRKASIQKTGAAKAKLYSMYAREIYQAAKNGGTDPVSNAVLKRLIEKAHKEQVPSDIINRAIEKVNSGVDENYQNTRYELFGPNGSTLLVDCLTDNVNRTLSDLRAILNKTEGKMGVTGSVAYMYDNLSIVRFQGTDIEKTLEVLLEQDIAVEDIEEEEGFITVYGEPTDLYKIKETIHQSFPNTVFEVEEIVMIPKEKVTLSNESQTEFNKLLTMLENVDDVQMVYHNVEL